MKTAQQWKQDAAAMKGKARQLTNAELAQCLASADACFERLASTPMNKLPLAKRVEQEAYMAARRTYVEAIELALKLRRVRSVVVGETTFALDHHGDVQFLDYRRTSQDKHSRSRLDQLLKQAV